MNNFERPNSNDPAYLALRSLMTHPKARTCVECGTDHMPIIHYPNDLDTVGLVYAQKTCTNCGRELNSEHDAGWSMRFRDEEARRIRRLRGVADPEETPCPHEALSDRRRAALQGAYLRMSDDEKLNHPELAPRKAKRNGQLVQD